MIIITERVVYIQRKDIDYFLHNDLVLKPIIDMIFSGGFFYNNSFIQEEFVPLGTPEAVEFFQKADWVIDYNQVKDSKEQDILRLGQSIAKEMNTIASRYHSMSGKEQKENENLVSKYMLLNFKMTSLRDILWFKQGHIKIQLPEGIDYPYESTLEKSTKKFIKNWFQAKKKMIHESLRKY